MLCAEKDVLLIADEVQTGIGRTEARSMHTSSLTFCRTF